MEKIITMMLSALLSINGSPLMTKETLMTMRRQFHGNVCSKLLNLNGVYAFTEKLANVDGIPADMRIHWATGNIFYTLVNQEMKMNLQLLRPSGEMERIKVPGLGQTTAVDNLNDIVYLGTDNGIYTYTDESIDIFTALGEDVMYIAVTNDGSYMFIATWPQNRVHKINNETQTMEIFTPITNGHGLTIDTRNHIYFVDVATEILYVLKSGHDVPIKIKGLNVDKMINVFVSRSDTIYGMDENSNLFLIDVDNEIARHLRNFNVTGVNTFAMDSADNIIIGVKGSITKYYVYEKNPCVGTEIQVPIHKHIRAKRRKTKTTTSSTTEDPEDYDDEE